MSTLQMQAVPVPFGAMRSGAPLPSARQLRWRALLAVALLVALGHAFLLGGLGTLAPQAGRAGGASPLSVRVVPAAPAAVMPPEAEAAIDLPAPAVPPAAKAPLPTAAARRPFRLPSEGATAGQKSTPAVVAAVAGAHSTAELLTAGHSGAGATEEPREVAVAAVAPPDVSMYRPGDIAVDRPSDIPGAAVPAGPASALLLAGEEPPPVYRTRLPPALTLRYEVRSGFLRGNGELRWRPQGDAYSLALEARVSGLTLLRQSSEGELGSEGLAPVRFLDQRARRSAQAANFRREAGKITFSGPATEWPLLPGSQDRLSFFVQLAGIAAGDPALRVEGARIVMIVAGARGDASVWSFRCMGAETIETGVGTVEAIKYVRDARSTYDTTAEIWLDPARHHLPAHATLRNRSGAAEVDLLLEGVDAAPP